MNSKISRWLGVGFDLCLVRSFLGWVLELMVFWIKLEVPERGELLFKVTEHITRYFFFSLSLSFV